jgi:hypothetical protein
MIHVVAGFNGIDRFEHPTPGGIMSRVLTMIASVVPALLAAQVPDTTPIPRELFRAISQGLGPYSPEVVVGKLPTTELTASIPPSLAVLGGSTMSFGRRAARPFVTTTVLTSLDSPDSALVVLREHLLRAGWKPAARGGITEGFAPASRRSEGSAFCRDSSSVTISARERDRGGALLTIGMQDFAAAPSGSTMTGPCVDRGGRFGFMSESPIKFPTLYPPDDAVPELGYGGGSGSGSAREIVARMRSRLNAQQMVEHYAKQMAAAGWSLRKPGGDKTASTLFMQKKEGEKHFYAFLSDYKTEDDLHSVVLRAEILPSRPQ